MHTAIINERFQCSYRNCLPNIFGRAGLHKISARHKSVDQPMKLSSSFKLALIFFVFAVLYIVVSDKLLFHQKGDDPDAYNRIQTFKGIGFVVLASVLIYL